MAGSWRRVEEDLVVWSSLGVKAFARISIPGADPAEEAHNGKPTFQL